MEDPENPESKVQTAQVKEAMHGNEFALQCGPGTMSEITHALDQSFKVFWDDSISLYKDTVFSSSNNKDFLNKLLDMRTKTEQHAEPPVTLIHGMETEVTLRETLLRIKVEQQEEAEAKARAAAEHVTEESQMEETEDQGGDDDSKEEISTFQEDMETIADFLVSDATPFTTKLIQGVPIRAMYSFEEHRKKP